MNDTFAFCDDLGPDKVVELYDAGAGLTALLVIDNVAAGPAIGGVRMAADADTEECFRLARAMTLKNAMAGLAHGGGKSVIVADPGAPEERKVQLVRAFAAAIADLRDYIPGPDMGTNEVFMAHVRDVCGRAVGLPREVGGIPLDEIGATGWGLAVALEVVARRGELTLQGARVVVQGYGSVGRHAAQFLVERGARLVGVADSRGARANPDGFALPELDAARRAGASVAEVHSGTAIEPEQLVALPSDIWIPAARPDVIHAGNADRVQARVIAEGANIAVTADAAERLAERGVPVLPDFVVNAGGVICAAVEYHGGSEANALATIEARIGRNVDAVLTRARARRETPRAAALAIATERVRTAMAFRRAR